MDLLKKHTIYFNSYETREEAFNQDVSNLIPCKYKGPQRFWRDFTRILNDRLPRYDQQTCAYITSNPKDCLTFGTPRQVLTAARMLALSTPDRNVSDLEPVAEEFDLLHNLDQPLRTLSGGETVKLALAKAFFLTPSSRKLSIASPFCWLAQKNIHLLEKVVIGFNKRALPVSIYALDEEDSLEVGGSMAASVSMFDKGPAFSVYTSNAKVILSSSLAPWQDIPQTAAIADARLRLISPCLIQGDNGQGKSLFARALSRAVKSSGQIGIGRSKNSSKLLFQDVINQTLLRSFNSLTQSLPHLQADEVTPVFKILQRYYHANLGESPAPFHNSENSSPPDLLTIKLVLLALRLVIKPSALIMDEPDWGLTRKSAEALVLAVIRCAHELDIPVMIISHKPWWNELAQSSLWVHKKNASSAIDPCRFTIVLKQS